MERFISGEKEKIFRINSHSLFVGLTIGGKHAWQQEEEQKGDGQGDGVPKAGLQQAAGDSRGSRTCACANHLHAPGWHTQGEG